MTAAAVGRAAAPAERPADLAARLALAAAAVAGALMALQQRINGDLERALGDALLTAGVSFGLGLLCVGAAVLVRQRGRRAVAAVRRVRWWECLGGLCGAALVTVSAAGAPQLGIALLTVGLVAGQTAGGLLVDRVGLGPGGRRALTAPRLAGALLCVLAAGVGVRGAGVRDTAPLLLVLVVAAGSSTAVQQALNGRVRATTGDAAVATAVNFGVGMLALLLVLGVRALATAPAIGQWPGLEQAHLYLGGPLGVVAVLVAAIVVRTLGVLRLGLALVAGQLVGAVLLDALLPLTGAELSGWTVLGAALTLLAVLVSGGSWRGGRLARDRAVPPPAGPSGGVRSPADRHAEPVTVEPSP